MNVYRAVEPLTPDDWMQDALCAQTDPDAYFPIKGGSNRAAKAICARCPVIQECREYSLRTRQRSGIWGGMGPKERARVLGERAT